MTNKEAVIWLINVTADIGKTEHSDLWHYEQALSEIKEMLESQPERKKGRWIDETFKPWGLVHHPYKCDQCGEHSETDSNYCPNCGSYNGGEQDVRNP